VLAALHLLKKQEYQQWSIQSKKWVEASRLKPGDVIRLANGNHAVIENINIVQLYQPILVYNFEVADYHTYYVADIGVKPDGVIDVFEVQSPTQSPSFMDSKMEQLGDLIGDAMGEASDWIPIPNK